VSSRTTATGDSNLPIPGGVQDPGGLHADAHGLLQRTFDSRAAEMNHFSPLYILAPLRQSPKEEER